MTDAAEDEFIELMRDKERRSAHPEDRHDEEARPSSNHDDTSDDETNRNDTHSYNHGDYEDDIDDDYDEAAFFSGPYSGRSTTRDNVPRTRVAANTGPKGVIADAQNYLDSQRANVQSTRASNTTTHIPAAERLNFPAGDVPESEIDALLGEGDEDSAFMQEWRQSRLRELQSGVNSPCMQQPDHRDRRDLTPWAGSMATVDGLGFLDALENSPPEVAVAVYIYDDRSEISRALEMCLRELIPSHPSTRFVKLHFHDAQMEPAGVPALLAYRGGDQFASLVPLVDELPDDAELAPETLERLLRSHHILR